MKRLALLFLLALPAACGSSSDDTPSGEMLFLEQHEDGNTFACANCHAMSEPAADGLRRPGHPLADVTLRPNYKNGQLNNLLDAVNVCRTEWMAAPAFEEEEPRWQNLLTYLESQAPAGQTTAEALAFEVVQPPATLGGGDPMVGQELFNGSCAVCHGENASGTNRAPNLLGSLLSEGVIATRVRTSGRQMSSVYNDLTGGRMPFWSAQRLTDAELVDIIAFVLSNEGGAGGGGGGGGATLRECDSTHSKIGQVANLTTFSHGVEGRAEIIDDCTVEITMFDFDGQGIDVQWYGAAGGDYDNGFSMSQDIRRPSPYVNETVFAQLPENRTLDDLDGISVWCVPVGTSFGDGLFQ